MALFILFPLIGSLVAIDPLSPLVNDESMAVTDNKESEVLSLQLGRLRNSRRLSMNFGGPNRQAISLKEAKEAVYHECCYEVRYNGNHFWKKSCSDHEVMENRGRLKQRDKEFFDDYVCQLREDRNYLKACREIKHLLRSPNQIKEIHLKSEGLCEDCFGVLCGDGECEDLLNDHKCICRDGNEAKYCNPVPMSLIWMQNLTNAGCDAYAKWGLARAFQREEKWVTKPACLVGKLPISVWYRLSQPTIIGRFSFRNRLEYYLNHNPLTFDFIGSTDCVNWKVISKFDNVKWSRREPELKEYTLNEDQRTLMEDNFFSCYGIKIWKVSYGRKPCIQDFRIFGLLAPLSLIKLENLERQKNLVYSVCNKGDLSHNVWYRLSEPTVIGRFSFRLPFRVTEIDFDFIGSTNCRTDWKVIEKYDDVYWRENQQNKKKTFTIKEDKIKLMEENSFSCYRIKVRSSNGIDCIQDFKMWRLENAVSASESPA